MSKDPAVLFFTSDFLAGTSFFTYEERGIYITLLCEQHQLYSIPAEHLVKLCGSLESPVAKKFMQDIDGSYFNIRMREETIKRKAFCESRRKSIEQRYVRSTHVAHTNIRMENGNGIEDVINNDLKEGIQGENKKKSFIPPTLEEFQAYFIENGYPLEYATRAYNGYNEAQWHDSRGKKIKNWKQKAQHVWFKPEMKITQNKSIFKQFGRQDIPIDDLKQQAIEFMKRNSNE